MNSLFLFLFQVFFLCIICCKNTTGVANIQQNLRHYVAKLVIELNIQIGYY
jgi:hypothetical protein